MKLALPANTGVKFWLTGVTNTGKLADNETAGIIFLAWRCLYAAVTKARVNDKPLNMEAAYARLILLIISRLKAQGQKWYRWYSRTRGISSKKVKAFPKRYRKRKLIQTTADASYTINAALFKEYENVKKDRVID